MDEIITGFETIQDVEAVLQVLEDKGWVWDSGDNPTEFNGWKENFEKYKKDGGLYIRNENKFWYGLLNFYNLKSKQIHFSTILGKLPKYWCTDATDEAVDYVNKTYNTEWIHGTIYGKYIGFNGITQHSGTSRYNDIGSFINNPIYLTPQQFMEAIGLTRGDIVIDDDGDTVEFVCDLGEEDSVHDRYIIRKHGEYYFSKSVTKKKEQTEIEKAIELLTREGKIKDGKILI